VRELIKVGYHHAEGIVVSPEQVALAHAQSLPQVRLGDLLTLLANGDVAWDAVVATDVLEHLDKEEVLHTFDSVARGLRPGGVFLARLPNAGRPFGGSIHYRDFTHGTWFTERSIRQVANASALRTATALPCRPTAHGLRSGLRVALWRGFESVMKLALAAATGVVHGTPLTQNLTFVARMPV